MAQTIAFDRGQADATVTIGVDNLNSGETRGKFVSGPPSRGQRFHRGIYMAQVDSATGTWRWVRDEPTPGTASPTDYQFLQNTR